MNVTVKTNVKLLVETLRKATETLEIRSSGQDEFQTSEAVSHRSEKRTEDRNR